MHSDGFRPWLALFLCIVTDKYTVDRATAKLGVAKSRGRWVIKREK